MPKDDKAEFRGIRGCWCLQIIPFQERETGRLVLMNRTAATKLFQICTAFDIRDLDKTKLDTLRSCKLPMVLFRAEFSI